MNYNQTEDFMRSFANQNYENVEEQQSPIEEDTLAEGISRDETPKDMSVGVTLFKQSTLYETEIYKEYEDVKNRHPPLKKARVFNQPTNSTYNESTHIISTPTILHQTPKPTKRKSQQTNPIDASQLSFTAQIFQNDANELSAQQSFQRGVNELSAQQIFQHGVNELSAQQIFQHDANELSAQQIVATPMNEPVKRVPPTSQRRRAVPASALKMVNLTRTVGRKQRDDLNPLYGPVQLKSVNCIKWAQGLEFNPNWVSAKHVPKWNPLPDNYLDFYGSTAGQKKTELKRKADAIVVRTINKFNGDMSKVRKYVWSLSQAHAESIRPYKEKMWELNTKYAELIKRHNDLVSVHNQLVQRVEAKKHTDNEKFFAEIKQEIRKVVSEWKSDA